LHKIRIRGCEPRSSIVSSSSNPAQLRPTFLRRYIGPRRRVQNLRCVVTYDTRTRRPLLPDWLSWRLLSLSLSLSLSLCGHLSYRLSARRTKITINGQSVRDVFGHRLRIAVRGRSDDGHRTLQLAMMNVHFTHAGSEYVSSSRTYPTRFSDILFVFKLLLFLKIIFDYPFISLNM
jgi:hypothetical protein